MKVSFAISRTVVLAAVYLIVGSTRSGALETLKPQWELYLAGTDGRLNRNQSNVDLSGNQLIIGAPGLEKALIYELNRNSGYRITAELPAPPSNSEQDRGRLVFGEHAAIEGNIAMVSGPRGLSLFERNASGDWIRATFEHRLRKRPTDPATILDVIPSNRNLNDRPTGEGNRPFIIGNNWILVEITNDATPLPSSGGSWHLLTRLQANHWQISYIVDQDFESRTDPMIKVGNYLVADNKSRSELRVYQVENQSLRFITTITRPAGLAPSAWRSDNTSLVIDSSQSLYYVDLAQTVPNQPLELSRFINDARRGASWRIEIYQDQIFVESRHPRHHPELFVPEEFSRSSHLGLASYPFPESIRFCQSCDPPTATPSPNFVILPPTLPPIIDSATNENIIRGNYDFGEWFFAKDGFLISSGPKDTILITDLTATRNQDPTITNFPESLEYHIAEGMFEFPLSASDPDGDELTWLISKGNVSINDPLFELESSTSTGTNTLLLDTSLHGHISLHGHPLELTVLDPHGGEAQVTIPVTAHRPEPPTLSPLGRPQDIYEDQHNQGFQSFSIRYGDGNLSRNNEKTLNPESLTWTIGPHIDGDRSQAPIGDFTLTLTEANGLPEVHIDYVPLPDWHGTDAFAVTVTDATGQSASSQFHFNVFAVNDPPEPQGVPMIQGNPAIGQILSINGPTWTDLESPPSELDITYRWFVANNPEGTNASPVPGVNQPILLVGPEYEGRFIGVEVTARDELSHLSLRHGINRGFNEILHTSIMSRFQAISAQQTRQPGTLFREVLPRPLDAVYEPKHLNATSMGTLNFFAGDWVSGFIHLEEPWRRIAINQTRVSPQFSTTSKEWRHNEDYLLIGDEHRQQLFLFEELIQPSTEYARPFFPNDFHDGDPISYPDGRFFSVGRAQRNAIEFRIHDYQEESNIVIETTQPPNSDEGYWINTAADELYLFDKAPLYTEFPYYEVNGEREPTWSFNSSVAEVFSFPEGALLRTIPLHCREQSNSTMTGRGAHQDIPLNHGWGTSPDRRSLVTECAVSLQGTSPEQFQQRKSKLNLLLHDAETGAVKRVIPQRDGPDRLLYEWETGHPLSRPVSGEDCFIIVRSQPDTELAAFEFYSWATGDVMKSILVEDGLFNHGAFYRKDSRTEWIYPSLNGPTLSVINLDTGETLDRFASFYGDLISSPTESLADVHISDNYQWITFREVFSKSVPGARHNSSEGVNVVVRHPLSTVEPEPPTDGTVRVYHEDFQGESDQWALVGTARLPDHVIHLTNPSRDQAGAAWYREPVPVTDDFEVTFEFRFNSPSSPGADGLALVIQNDARGVNAIGGIAQSFGVFPNPPEGTPQGVQPSLAIAFNLLNQDRASIVVTEAGSNRPQTLTNQTLGIGPNRSYLVSARYHALTSQLSVTMNGRTILDRVALPQRLTEWFGSETAHVGFTAATGDLWQRHSIESFSWISEPSNARLALTLSASATEIFSGDTLTLTSHLDDSEGIMTDATVRFLRNGEQVEERQQTPYTATIQGLAPGENEFVAIAETPNLPSLQSAPLIVTVLSQPDEGHANPVDTPAPHPADRDQDFRLTITEVTSYGSAWLHGDAWPLGPNPIPITYVTSAGTLWFNGETYHHDSSIGNAPQWWVSAPVHQSQRFSSRPQARSSKFEVRRNTHGNLVTLTLPRFDQPLAIAIEERLPNGLAVDSISAGGHWNPTTQTLRWGPFLTESPGLLTYEVIAPAEAPLVDSIFGIASINGQARTITRPESAPAQEFPASLSIKADDNSLRITIEGTPFKTYLLESAPSITSSNWQRLLQLQLPASGRQTIPLAPHEDTQHFYRLKQ